MMASMFATTPRKRRPRAVGEVCISSASSVYLCEIVDPINTELVAEICEPIYENAEIVPTVRNRRNRPNSQAPVKVASQQEFGGFSKCRISLPELESGNPVAGRSIDNKIAPEMETQCISSFIGEAILLCQFGICVFM